MATTYKSDAAVKGYVARPTANNPTEITATCVVPAGTALALNDVFRFFKLGPNVIPESVYIQYDDFCADTDLAWSIGTSEDDDVFQASSTIGRAAGSVIYGPAGTAFSENPFVPQSDSVWVQAKVATAPTTQTTEQAAARSLTVTVRAYVEPSVAAAEDVYTPPTPA